MPAIQKMLLLLLLALAPGLATAAPPDPIRVLFVGNSITYTHNLPRLVGAIAASQGEGPAIGTATFVIPGAELDDLWDDSGAAAALRDGKWDVVVLQELGGLLSCTVRDGRDPSCRRSEAAHRKFVELAQKRGARVLLLMAWPRARGADLGTAAELRVRKARLFDVHQKFANRLARSGADVAVVPAAAAIYDFGVGRPMAEVLTDGIHPSMEASLVMAAQLYAAIAGRQPKAADLLVDFPLLPPNAAVEAGTPMETQAQIAGDGSRYRIPAKLLAPLYGFAAASQP